MGEKVLRMTFPSTGWPVSAHGMHVNGRHCTVHRCHNLFIALSFEFHLSSKVPCTEPGPGDGGGGGECESQTKIFFMYLFD